MPAPGGKIGHAEIELGDSRDHAGRRAPRDGCAGPEDDRRHAGDDHGLRRGRGRGLPARPSRPAPGPQRAVEDQFYGDRRGQSRTRSATVDVATHKEDVSPDEMEKRAAAAMGGERPAPWRPPWPPSISCLFTVLSPPLSWRPPPWHPPPTAAPSSSRLTVSVWLGIRRPRSRIGMASPGGLRVERCEVEERVGVGEAVRPLEDDATAFRRTGRPRRSGPAMRRKPWLLGVEALAGSGVGRPSSRRRGRRSRGGAQAGRLASGGCGSDGVGSRWAGAGPLGGPADGSSSPPPEVRARSLPRAAPPPGAPAAAAARRGGAATGGCGGGGGDG